MTNSFVDDFLFIVCLKLFVISIHKGVLCTLIMLDLDSMQSASVSPFCNQQQQLTMPAQQQSFLMDDSAKPNGGFQGVPAIVYQPGSYGVHLANQTWGSVGHQVPTMMVPLAYPQNYMQV